ncbi:MULTISPECIES: hypothetical protein [Streptomyces]|uniref:Uncharacterized protein n=1 Tax=Streptomyces eurythermus TaxID=42237 RepID=A0ABW6Z3N6_9ACTN|nr:MULTISPECIES: hypothetical protein [Streptomyces]QIS75140.1 hypothetical protein HB370_38600 [Streptomyces sp. DSM 40868]
MTTALLSGTDPNPSQAGPLQQPHTARTRLDAPRLHPPRLEADRGMLTITEEADRLPLFTPGTVLVSPRHAGPVRRRLPGRPITAGPAGIAMTLVALDRATAALHPAAAARKATCWGCTAGALALHGRSAKPARRTGWALPIAGSKGPPGGWPYAMHRQWMTSPS